jgi:hypothetical protein
MPEDSDKPAGGPRGAGDPAVPAATAAAAAAATAPSARPANGRSQEPRSLVEFALEVLHEGGAAPSLGTLQAGGAHTASPLQAGQRPPPFAPASPPAPRPICQGRPDRCRRRGVARWRRARGARRLRRRRGRRRSSAGKARSGRPQRQGGGQVSRAALGGGYGDATPGARLDALRPMSCQPPRSSPGAAALRLA